MSRFKNEEQTIVIADSGKEFNLDDLDSASILGVIDAICDNAECDPLSILFAIEDSTEHECADENTAMLIKFILEQSQSNYDYALQLCIAYFAATQDEESDSIGE